MVTLLPCLDPKEGVTQKAYAFCISTDSVRGIRGREDKGLKVKSSLSRFPPSCLGEPLPTEGHTPPRQRPFGEVPHGSQVAVLLSKSFRMASCPKCNGRTLVISRVGHVPGTKRPRHCPRHGPLPWVASTLTATGTSLPLLPLGPPTTRPRDVPRVKPVTWRSREFNGNGLGHDG